MTQNEFKFGDKVRLKEFPGMNPYYKGRVCEITSIDNNEYVTFKEGGIHPQVWELELVEPIDRRTAFLTRLQSLLREFDARIYDGELYAIHIELGYHSPKSEQVDYLFYNSDNDEINAENIMDFNKE